MTTACLLEIQRMAQSLADKINVSLTLKLSGRNQYEGIVEAVSTVTGIPREEIMGHSRVQEIAWARQMAMSLCRKAGGSYATVGHYFRRDHGTVMHAMSAVSARIETDKHFAATWEQVKAAINSPPPIDARAGDTFEP